MSTETKWQPGPWRRDDRDTLRDANGRQVLFTGLSLLAGYSPDAESYAANTHLADTAPALYEALAEVMSVLDGKANYHEYQATAFDSIGEPDLVPNVRHHDEMAKKARAVEAKALAALRAARREG